MLGLFLQIEQAAIQLESESEWVRQGWRTFFDFGLHVRHEMPAFTPILAQIKVVETEELPRLPNQPPIFQDKREWGVDERRTLSVYKGETADHAIIFFHEGAHICVPVGAQANLPVATITIKPHFDWGRLEDVMMLTLATLLRPLGYFMIHAFAAVLNGKAVLLVGSRHSGKTTTGLNLVAHGWQFLGNDVILLRQSNAGIFALPSPGIVCVRPKSIPLLPQLRPIFSQITPNSLDGKYYFSPNKLIDEQLVEPAPIAIIGFPQVQSAPNTHLVRLPRAVALAHLMQESVDSWDTATLEQHTSFLQKLTQQSDVFSLQLGQTMAQLPALLAIKLNEKNNNDII
jgi:hypothetical protein